MISPKARKMENLHIVLWLLKDLCWVTTFKVGGILMVAPTVGMAIYITLLLWKTVSERFYNLAVVCWITANSLWMLGEFFENEAGRYAAIVSFSLGLLCILYYYLVVLQKDYE